VEVGRARALALAAALALAGPAAADGPRVEHQPVPCTVAAKPFSICATISDDVRVTRARVYFRPDGHDYFSFVDMAFEGLRYCGTLPAPRAGKRKLEYYVQGLDEAYDTQRTASHWIAVKPAADCPYAPVEADPARAGRIVVYATHPKQGKKLHDAFLATGVSFVPVQAR
jgi:hypothetical protein